MFLLVPQIVTDFIVDSINHRSVQIGGGSIDLLHPLLVRFAMDAGPGELNARPAVVHVENLVASGINVKAFVRIPELTVAARKI